VVAGTHVSAEARQAVLARVRTALADVPADEPPVDQAAAAPAPAAAPPAGLVDLFVERVEDYRATVTRCAPGDIAATIARICDRHDARRVALPAALNRDWLPDAIDAAADDPPLSVDDLDAVDGVITGSALGIAETGTIVLDGGPASGRRSLTLVPDLHVCVVSADDLVADVSEAIEAMKPGAEAGRPVTLVSGPSATSDIELDRVEGVHGPRRLEVVLVQEARQTEG
jgi:L-lactate dehydrogenase complex protein LldG